MAVNLNRLKQILREMFQFDQADLDFGIYRIMNQKRAEVERFLDDELLPQVKDAFSVFSSADKALLTQEMEKLKKTLEDAGVIAETAPKYQEMQARVEKAADLEALEQDVFSHLVTFFSRYYDNGDFLSRRRYKAGVYALPYAGEEVKLHWANADQYYIKTTEFFRDYTFSLPSGKKVHFKIVEASTEQNNNKEQNGKERLFFLHEESPLLAENNELHIRFKYNIREERQDELNAQANQYLLANAVSEPIKDYVELFTLSPTESNPNRSLLEKHLRDYTARNTFDYFIHKDLGGFLRRELDFYLKNEVMHIDDLDTENELKVEQYLSKIKVIKRIAHKIIVFLDQLESFQKMLWLKKKFVIETNYCLTLDKVPEELYPGILTNER